MTIENSTANSSENTTLRFKKIHTHSRLLERVLDVNLIPEKILDEACYDCLATYTFPIQHFKHQMTYISLNHGGNPEHTAQHFLSMLSYNNNGSFGVASFLRSQPSAELVTEMEAELWGLYHYAFDVFGDLKAYKKIDRRKHIWTCFFEGSLAEFINQYHFKRPMLYQVTSFELVHRVYVLELGKAFELIRETADFLYKDKIKDVYDDALVYAEIQSYEELIHQLNEIESLKEEAQRVVDNQQD